MSSYVNFSRVFLKDQYKDYLPGLVTLASLYPPLEKAATACSDFHRAYTAKSYFELAVAVASLAGTVFKHPAGIAIKTAHSLASDLYHLYKANDRYQAAQYALQVVNHALYLATFGSSSLKLRITSSVFQVVSNLLSSKEEFQKYNGFEGTLHLIVAFLRLKQLKSQIDQWKQMKAIQQVFVGYLQEKWQFPSDHLPIGVEVDGVKIVSWNVMNNAYIDWVVEKDSQGLKRSMLGELNVKVQPDGLTRRDLKVIETIHSMMSSSNDVIALQECGHPFLGKLESTLLSNWKIIQAPKGKEDNVAILYNTSRIVAHTAAADPCYPSRAGSPALNVLFEKVGQIGKMIRVINTHIPGDPLLPGRAEFASYVRKNQSPHEVTVALGDCNFERAEMQDAYQKAGCLGQLISPWKTNIDPYSKKSKGIDHVYVEGESSRPLTADGIVGPDSRLKETIGLLNTPINIDK